MGGGYSTPSTLQCIVDGIVQDSSSDDNETSHKQQQNQPNKLRSLISQNDTNDNNKKKKAKTVRTNLKKKCVQGCVALGCGNNQSSIINSYSSTSTNNEIFRVKPSTSSRSSQNSQSTSKREDNNNDLMSGFLGAFNCVDVSNVKKKNESEKVLPAVVPLVIPTTLAAVIAPATPDEIWEKKLKKIQSTSRDERLKELRDLSTQGGFVSRVSRAVNEKNEAENKSIPTVDEVALKSKFSFTSDLTGAVETEGDKTNNGNVVSASKKKKKKKNKLDIPSTSLDNIPTDDNLYNAGWAKYYDQTAQNYYYFKLDNSVIQWQIPLLSSRPLIPPKQNKELRIGMQRNSG